MPHKERWVLIDSHPREHDENDCETYCLNALRITHVRRSDVRTLYEYIITLSHNLLSETLRILRSKKALYTSQSKDLFN